MAQSYQAMMDARFATAERHSRRVRVLRKAVPAVIAIALLGTVATSIFNPFRMLVKLPLDMGDLVVSGTKITMEAPHLSGFTPDHRPYELRAKTAAQDVTNPNQIELEILKAKVQMQDESFVDMDARHGTFNNKEQTLDLRDAIVLKSSTGYEAQLTEATIDIGKGNVTSNKPVAVKLLNGTLDAKKLEITERGALLRFDGGVSMTLYLGGTAAKSDGPR